MKSPKQAADPPASQVNSQANPTPVAPHQPLPTGGWFRRFISRVAGLFRPKNTPHPNVPAAAAPPTQATNTPPNKDAYTTSDPGPQRASGASASRTHPNTHTRRSNRGGVSFNSSSKSPAKVPSTKTKRPANAGTPLADSAGLATNAPPTPAHSDPEVPPTNSSDNSPKPDAYLETGASTIQGPAEANKPPKDDTDSIPNTNVRPTSATADFPVPGDENASPQGDPVSTSNLSVQLATGAGAVPNVKKDPFKTKAWNALRMALKVAQEVSNLAPFAGLGSALGVLNGVLDKLDVRYRRNV